MIRHFVLLNWKPDLEDSDREWILGQCRALAKIPSVKRLAMGALLQPGEEWYVPRMWTDFQWAMTMEFDDEAALYEYQTDPYHAVVAQEIRKRVTIIKVTDFVAA